MTILKKLVAVSVSYYYVKKKQKTSFNEKHSDQYDLKIVCWDTKGCVKSIVCKFCQVFGRKDRGDDNGGNVRKRKKTTNAKYYSGFRADYYKTHLTNQHLLKHLLKERAVSLFEINNEGIIMHLLHIMWINNSIQLTISASNKRRN